MPQDFVAAAILKSIRSIDGYPNLEALDLSCGRGEILSALIKDGCTARGTHYRSDDYKLTQQFTPRNYLSARYNFSGDDRELPSVKRAIGSTLDSYNLTQSDSGTSL